MANRFSATISTIFIRSQPAIEKLDLDGDKAVRVTGKDDFVWEPFWLSASEFLCIIQEENENEPSIYRMALDGKIRRSS